MSDVERFDQTLLEYFAMLLLCLMVKMVELKELLFRSANGVIKKTILYSR